MLTNLDDVLTTLTKLPPKARHELTQKAAAVRARYKWIPNPGPQTDAYYSKADVLLFGGEPGGGKSQLLLGLAFNCHQRTLIMRRKYGELSRIIEDTIKIHGSRDGFNGSPPPKLRISDKQIISFGAAQYAGDEQSQMGQGRDLLAIDEATHFAESQIRFLMGWNRSEDPNQRVRTVLATNPPLTADGLWVISMFAPWLDPQYPNPAKPGELRYAISDADGKQKWVDGPGEVSVNGVAVRPKSYTYIPSSVSDNPYYANTDYERELQALPEPYRSLLMGGFRTAFQDAANQVIPTDWVTQAQQRWRPQPPAGVPMCAIGVDPAQGGDDETVIAPRHDGWYPLPIAIPGKQTPFGRDVAGVVLAHRRDQSLVIVDLGGGYGGSTFEHLRDNGVDVQGFKGSEESTRRTKDRQLKFYNRRSEAYWRFREALDPSQPGGSPIMLPDDPKLVADLTAPCLDMSFNGIKIEPKDKLVARLGRSTDRGDAVVMAWSAGPTYITDGAEWAAQRRMTQPLGRAPQILIGRQHAQRRR